MDRPTPQEINETIARILRSPEFRGAYEQSATQEYVPPSNSGRGWNPPVLDWDLLVWILIIAAVAAVVMFFVLRFERGRRWNKAQSGEKKEKENGVASDPLETALTLAQRGEYDGAVSSLFILHLQSLRDQGLVVMEKSKTNLQYEFELMQKGYGDLGGYRAFRQVFNDVRFGERGADRNTFEQWLGYCREKMDRRQAI